MNKYLVLSKVLTIIGSICSCILYIFCLYVLLSPGMMRLFVVAIILGVVCVYINIGACLSRKKKKEQDYVLYIEGEYARTYRTRFHNRLYISIIVSLFIISLLFTVSIMKDQFNKNLNDKFIESVESLYTSDSDTLIILDKVDILIPSELKKSIIVVLDCMNEINKVLSELIEMKEDITLTEEVNQHTNNKVEELTIRFNSVKELVQRAQVQALLLALSLSVLRITYGEVCSYTKHHSIELK